MRLAKPLILILLLFFVILLGRLAHSPGYYSTTKYTCLHCRAIDQQRTFFGFPANRLILSDYSKTYLQKNLDHLHQWRWEGGRYIFTLKGETTRCGRRHPIWEFPIEIQERYALMVTTAELNETLELIDTADKPIALAEIKRISDQVLDGSKTAGK